MSKPVIVEMLCRSCSKLLGAPVWNYERILAGTRLTVDQIEGIRYFHSLGLSNGFIAEDQGCSVMSVWRVLRQRREFGYRIPKKRT